MAAGRCQFGRRRHRRRRHLRLVLSRSATAAAVVRHQCCSSNTSADRTRVYARVEGPSSCVQDCSTSVNRCRSWYVAVYRPAGRAEAYHKGFCATILQDIVDRVGGSLAVFENRPPFCNLVNLSGTISTTNVRSSSKFKHVRTSLTAHVFSSRGM